MSTSTERTAKYRAKAGRVLPMIAIDEELTEKVRKLCEERALTTSALIRDLIRRAKLRAVL